MALANNEFMYYYQPVISLSAGRITGAEALLRWVPPDGKIIPPSDFIPLAEETGFIVEMTQELIPKLMADLVTIQKGYPSLEIAMNLSANEILNRDLIDYLLRQIKEHHLDPFKFSVEITERQAVEPDNNIQEAILPLSSAGVGIALDDFGTGYASVELLRELPITKLKLDQTFVRGVSDCEKSSHIIRHGIRLAHQLGIETIAEGVETKDIVEFLTCFGCDYVQGFYFTRPLPLPDFLNFIRDTFHFEANPTGFIHLGQQDHIDWRRDLIREILIIIKSKNSKDVARDCQKLPPLSPKDCLLGKWIYGPGQLFRGNSIFDQMLSKHEHLHEAAITLVNVACNGKQEKQIDQLIQSVNKHTIELMILLMEMHTQLVIKANDLPMFG